MRFVATIIAFLTGVVAYSQSRQITGRVVDEETQKGIAGATVTISDTERKTATNRLGYFSLTVASSDKTVLISSIGFMVSTINVPGNNAFKAPVKRNYLPLVGLDLGTFPLEDLGPPDTTGSARTALTQEDTDFAAYPGGWQYFYNDLALALRNKSRKNLFLDSTKSILFTVANSGLIIDVRIPGGTDSLKMILKGVFRNLKAWRPATQNQFAIAQHFELPLKWTEEVRPEDIIAASPMGGTRKFYEYVGRNIKYPPKARNNSVTGKVYVGFFIERDGSLTGARAVKGIGFGCDEEAVRVVSLSPKWNPATHKGQPTRQYFTLPISFSIEGVIADENNAFPKSYYEWMTTNLQYPSLARRLNVEGTVLMSFKVSKTGKIDSIQLLEDIGSNCGKEAVRVLKTVPREYSAALGTKGGRLYQRLHFRLADPMANDRVEENQPGADVLFPIVVTAFDGEIPTTAPSAFGLQMMRLLHEPESFDEALANQPRRVFSLNLVRKNVVSVPHEIGELENLQSLDLEGNKIQTLPPEIGSLKKLVELRAPENELKTLPVEFINLKSLRVLMLANNKFEEFPKPVLLLTKLKTLDLSGNQITSLPIGIGDLRNLETLRLHNNYLKTIPEQLFQLTQLKTLTIGGNDLSDKDKRLLMAKLKTTDVRFE